MPTFSKQDRLRSPSDFKRVYDRKCSVSNQWLIVFYLLQRHRRRIRLITVLP